MTTSLVLDPIAVALKGKIGAISVTFASGTQALTGHQWEPQEFDSLPAGSVGTPEVVRVGLDEPEMQMGSYVWRITYVVSLYFDLSEASASQGQMVEAAEAFIKAVDADGQLAGTVDDAKVTRVTPFVEQNRNRPLVGYECTVEILKQVP